MLGIILVALLIIFFVGSFPTWSHSRRWGYYPSTGLGLVLVLVLVLYALGRI